ncbi:MAG TPA: MFS transporter, partial [Desulfobacteraceae bacterium]|nr:MFS transporter [Desulfobacteraceae bacterium]
MTRFIPSAHGGIFLILFFTIFTTVTGVGMVVPLLPVYADELGASGLYVGMIFGAFSFSRVLFLPYWGRLSDAKGRKPFILAGLAGYALF